MLSAGTVLGLLWLAIFLLFPPAAGAFLTIRRLGRGPAVWAILAVPLCWLVPIGTLAIGSEVFSREPLIVLVKSVGSLWIFVCLPIEAVLVWFVFAATKNVAWAGPVTAGCNALPTLAVLLALAQSSIGISP